MLRRTDTSSILVIGPGPIIIGQVCEFDYSGIQVCRVLKTEGFWVVLVNSNPATIMTDPGFADATYIELITPELAERVIVQERPDALPATLGGQTTFNTTVTLHEKGVLEKYGCELIGVFFEAVQRGEDREQFRAIVESLTDIPGDAPEAAWSRVRHNLEEVMAAAGELGYPVVVRPFFTMGGAGSGLAHDPGELRRIVGTGLATSSVTEVLVEESILDRKEYEPEVMRDKADSVVIACPIENFDPMGVHAGDFVMAAPAMTLTDRGYQRVCDVGTAIIRAVGVDTGGCNIQFAMNPDDGRMIVTEMNPRVLRNSVLASRATGFPTAKIVAKVAAGYTLDEIPNDTTRTTLVSFEPALDYVVIKVPRLVLEKFPAAGSTLTTHMKLVGEVMSIGRNFTETLGRAMRSTETGTGFWLDQADGSLGTLLMELRCPHDGRVSKLMDVLNADATVEQLHEATRIDPWFPDQIALIQQVGTEVREADHLSPELLRRAKRHGLSDVQIGRLRGFDESVIRQLRWALDIHPVYKAVDTYAAKFEVLTPHLYSTYEGGSEVSARTRQAVLAPGSGSNRIDQGIGSDYSCAHATIALRDAGHEIIMVNCNPETVSTDYDTSDRLYFEPLTVGDALEVYHAETLAGPAAGVIYQLGGRAPLKLVQTLKNAGVSIIGTSPEVIDLAEDRGAFGRVLANAGLPAPRHGMAASAAETKRVASEIGYPVPVRPSFVLGGRGMEIAHDAAALDRYIAGATEVSDGVPVLVDWFLDGTIEINVDALYDGEELYLGGVMEHIEEAGIYSGDSICSLPPITLGNEMIERIRDSTCLIVEGVGVRGLLNIQYVLQLDILYVLEVNPRTSRMVPFVPKATNTLLAKAAARIMLGVLIRGSRGEGLLRPTGDGTDMRLGSPVIVKEAVTPFNRFCTASGIFVDILLGPEMRSTDEMMGLDLSFGTIHTRTQSAGGFPVLSEGTVLVSIANRDERHVIWPIKCLADLGLRILATSGTTSVLRRNGIAVQEVRKLSQCVKGDNTPSIVDLIKNGGIDLIFDTPQGASADMNPRKDDYLIHTASILADVPCITMVPTMTAIVQSIESGRAGYLEVRFLQDWAARL